jgi:hypothetical protein
MNSNDVRVFQETALQGTSVEVPSEYWDRLAAADPKEVSRRTLARAVEGGYDLPFLEQPLFVDPNTRRLLDGDRKPARRLQRPLLVLVVLVYLLFAVEAEEAGEPVSARDLPAGHFFRGPHALPTDRIVGRFGADGASFLAAGQALGGVPLDLAEAAVRLTPLPRIPLFLLFWEADEEFPAEASVLFDRSISRHLSPDAIWGLVNLVVDLLVSEPPGF